MPADKDSPIPPLPEISKPSLSKSDLIKWPKNIKKWRVISILKDENELYQAQACFGNFFTGKVWKNYETPQETCHDAIALIGRECDEVEVVWDGSK